MTLSHLFTDQYAARTCIEREMQAIYSPVSPAHSSWRAVVPVDCTRVSHAWINHTNETRRHRDLIAAGARAPVSIPTIHVAHVADIHIFTCSPVNHAGSCCVM